MKSSFFAVIALAAIVTSPASARPHRTVTLAAECNVTMPCLGGYYSRKAKRFMNVPFGIPLQHYTPQRIKYQPVPSHLGSDPRPSHYISGRLVCAINVNSALAERGIKGTGSALAHSFDRWGRPSSPQVGAVAITDRRGGGHVAIVSRVEGGRVWVWNATGSHHGWHEIEYTNRNARYRVASQ
jgi:hypothetical protein